MKILFHTHLAVDYPERIRSFAGRFPGHDIATAGSRDDLFREITDADVLVDYRMTPELLDRAGRLKWLFVPFTGVNSIPFPLLASRNIRVCNNHGNSFLVAERAVALALALMGRVPEFDKGMRRGHWFRNEGKENPFRFWESLRGKKVSILGTGAIGREIARLLEPWGCCITGWRRRRDAEVPDGFDKVPVDPDEVFSGCEVCFVALPLTEETRGLIGRREMELMCGGRLVNVARGPVVDEKALYESLVDGTLAGAALDVWHRYPEPFHADRLPSEYPFHRLENVVLSPHAGSHAPEGKAGQLDGTLENLAALLETGEPEDIVDPSRKY